MQSGAIIFFGIIIGFGFTILLKILSDLIKVSGKDHECQICGGTENITSAIGVCDLCLNDFDRRIFYYERKYQEHLSSKEVR